MEQVILSLVYICIQAGDTIIKIWSPFGDIMFWVHICANSGYLVEAGQYISRDTLDSSSYKTDIHDTKHIILFLLQSGNQYHCHTEKNPVDI
jgi:hypothetical protein